MEPFTTHTGRAVSLRRSSVDTDQIIPSEYLKRVTRAGFGDGLFATWRTDPGFVLNQPEAQGATILVAGPDFGIGSSRQHAVWALADYGFRAVISARFGDIFYNNSIQEGLLPVLLPAAAVTSLQDAIEADPQLRITVDLAGREVRAGGAGEPQLTAALKIDDYTRWRLMEGLDDISLTLRHADDITRYEAGRGLAPGGRLRAQPAPGAASPAAVPGRAPGPARGKVASVRPMITPPGSHPMVTRWPGRSSRRPEPAKAAGPNPTTVPSSRNTLPDPAAGSKLRTVACMTGSLPGGRRGGDGGSQRSPGRLRSAVWMIRFHSCAGGSPVASHMSGNADADVIPGMVLISLRMIRPSGV